MAITWNASDKASGITLSSGNLIASSSTTSNQAVRANFSHSAGKWYYEVSFGGLPLSGTIGVANASASLTGRVGGDGNGWGYDSNGSTYHSGTATIGGSTYAAADTVGVAWDAAGNIWFSKNGSWVTGDPSTGTSPSYTGVTGTLFPMVSLNYTTGSANNALANFGATSFTEVTPTNFIGWGVSKPSTTTWNPSDRDATNTILSNGNLTATFIGGSGGYSGVRSTNGYFSGKWYFEVTQTSSYMSAGVANSTWPVTLAASEFVGEDVNGWGYVGTTFNEYLHNSVGTTTGSWNTGTILMVAVDLDGGQIWFGNNGTWFNSGNPSTLSNPSLTGIPVTTIFAGVSGRTNTTQPVSTTNFGATAFTYTIPTNFQAWNGPNSNDGTFALTETQDTPAITGDVFTIAHGSLAVTDTQDTAALPGTIFVIVDATFALTDTQDASTINATALSYVSVDFTLTDIQDGCITFGGVEAGPTKTIIAVGDAGNVVTSTDGITWTAQSVGTTNQLNGVAFDGIVNWVVVGAAGSIYLSTDTVTWAKQTSPTTGTYQAVCYGNGLWVAVDGNGNIVTSPDAINWTKQFTGTSSLFGVTYGNGTYVAVGGAGRLYSSPNGTTWTLRTNPYGSTYAFRGVVYGGTIFVATGSNGKIIASGDGATWVTRSNGDTITSNGVAYSGSVWTSALSTNSPGKVDKSTNSTTWNAISVNGFSSTFGAIVYTWNQWVLVGGRNSPAELLIYTSPDATTWTNTYSPSAVAVFRGVTWGTLPAILYISGTLKATDNQDSATINCTGIPIVVGTFVLTEAQDAFVAHGFSNATVHGPLIVTDTADTIAISGTQVFVGSFGSFALTESPDLFVSTGDVSAQRIIVVWVSAIETQDSVAIHADVPVEVNITTVETQDNALFLWKGPGNLTIKILPASFDDIVNFGADIFNGGFLQIYTGSQPASPSDAPIGTLLGTIPLPATAFTPSTGGAGAATIAGTWQSNALTNGNAGWFRLTDSLGANVIDGSAGGQTSGADLIMSNPSMNVGDQLIVTSVTFQFQLLDGS